MSDSMPYADIVIIALIAGFILLRLRGVLGQKTGFEAPPARDVLETKDNETVVQLTEKARAKQEEEKAKDDALISAVNDSAAREGLRAIKAADSNFSLKNFLEGARGAFDMVFSAFNKGDKQTLQMLLAPALSATFAAEYDRRQISENKPETTLVSIESEEVTAASLNKNTARITVRFISEQISVTRNRDGAIVEGNPSLPERVEDEWVFERDTGSRNPNWKIIDT